MENITTYLKDLFQTQPSQLTEEESKILKFEGEKKFILSKLYSNRYKGSKFPPELDKKIDEVVTAAIATRKPIHLSVPFGGFKKWQQPSYPNIDWAEIFNLIQMRNLSCEIAKGYEPGVIIQYVSDEIFISKMNNMPQQDLDQYNNLFTLALAYFQQFCPPNVMLRYTKIRDEISQKEIFRRFDIGIASLKKEWETLPAEEKSKRIEKTKRNLRVSDEHKTKEELQQLYLESTMIHDAFIFSDWEQGVPWAFRHDMIPVGFRYTNKWGIHLKSSPSSTVQFWVGYGVLLQRGKDFIPSILTYNQYLENKEKLSIKRTAALPEIFGLTTIPLLNQGNTKSQK